jgi:TRAP-type uncharacterized transport system fused permease subunit
MVKKENNGGFWGMLQAVMFGVKEFLSTFAARIQDAVIYTEEKVLQLLYASVIFITGVVFLCAAAVNLMTQYLQLSRGWSYLIIGLILILAAMTIKNKAVRDLRKRR